MPNASAPSSRTLLLSLAALVAVAATVIAACERGGNPYLPDGWEAVSEDRWIRTGADTTGAFRDLSSVEAMGVADSSNDVVRYAKEQMLYLYRTAPEVVDSVFTAVAVPMLDRSFPSQGFQDEVDRVVNDAKIAILGSRENQAVYRQATTKPAPAPEAAVYPDSIAARGVTGEVVVQALIDETGQPAAVQVIESLNPTLDALVMRQVATTTFNPAWVVEGRRGGRNIRNYTRVPMTFE